MQFRTELWKSRSFIATLLFVTLSFVSHSRVAASTLDEIVKKANQEGRIVVQMSEPQGGSAAEANRRITAGVKKTFGADVKVTIHRAASYPAATAQVLSEIKA